MNVVAFFFLVTNVNMMSVLLDIPSLSGVSDMDYPLQGPGLLTVPNLPELSAVRRVPLPPELVEQFSRILWLIKDKSGFPLEVTLFRFFFSVLKMHILDVSERVNWYLHYQLIWCEYATLYIYSKLKVDDFIVNILMETPVFPLNINCRYAVQLHDGCFSRDFSSMAHDRQRHLFMELRRRVSTIALERVTKVQPICDYLC